MTRKKGSRFHVIIATDFGHAGSSNTGLERMMGDRFRIERIADQRSGDEVTHVVNENSLNYFKTSKIRKDFGTAFKNIWIFM